MAETTSMSFKIPSVLKDILIKIVDITNPEFLITDLKLEV